MWGIYFDSSAFEDGLFQAVVQYRIDNGKALVILPKANYELDIKRIRELPASPRFIYAHGHPEEHVIKPINRFDCRDSLAFQA